MAKTDPLTIRVQLLELEIELRLGTFLLSTLSGTEENQKALLEYLRYAYGRGYQDALADQPRGKLFREHGFPVPKRKQP